MTNTLTSDLTVTLAELDRGRLSPDALAELDSAILIAAEQNLPITAETVAAWCADRIERYMAPPMCKRADAMRHRDALTEIRRGLGIAGVAIAIVPIEVDGVRGVVAEIRDAASCVHIDSTGRKRLGDVAGKSADRRALTEALAICRVRGLRLVHGILASEI